MNPHNHEWVVHQEELKTVTGSTRLTRRCDCGETQVQMRRSNGSATGWVPTPHASHEHDWITTREEDPIGKLTYRRECQVCGEVQYREGDGGTAWAASAHEHRWGMIRRNRMTGEMYRRCELCGEEQRNGEVTVPPVARINSLRTPGATRVAEHGGVTKYDPATEVVTLLDGATVTIEALAVANPGVHHGELHAELMKFAPKPKHGLTPEQVEALSAAMKAGTLSAAEASEALTKLGSALKVEVSGNTHPSNSGVKPWTSDDALTLILEEIKHDPDPLAAAGKWITKVTNGITDITRNLDDQ